MKKHTIRLHPLGKELRVNDQTPLIDVLHEYGIEFPCGGLGSCGKCKVRVLEGTVNMDLKHQQKLHKLGLNEEWRLACHSNCTDDLTLEIGQFDHIILGDESEFDFIPRNGLGVAVDLGTTTIVGQLIDLSDSRVLAVESMLNPQVKYGADLISRIQACLNGHEDEMTRIIRSGVGKMIEAMLEKHNGELENIVLVGNSVMQLIFGNCDVSPLAMYPFHVEDLGMKTFTTEELGWTFKVKGKVRFYPSIGSFVGSDILAGIAATGLHQKENYTALIDLGTNGEIVVGNKERIVCASTAAGPAFEGSNISMGMRAVTGAISSFNLEKGIITARVIGNTPPKGICGSALIDGVAVLRKSELIGSFGEINSGESEVTLIDKITLSQKDINEFQLAKAALAAGLTILANSLKIDVNDIHEIYIAGGFGNYVNLTNVTETGMIELPEDRIRKMGNTALIGAKIFLFADQTLHTDILAKTVHLNLEGDACFQDIYVDKMLL